MEKHAESSGGRYFVWNEVTKEVCGPFYPADRMERFSIFVRETQVGEGWLGAYWRRLPQWARREADRLVGQEKG